jgi:RNA polymerase sigma-70 factor (ECF subfamily)
MLEPSDGQLVADVLAGGAEQFGALVRRYELPLARAAQSRLGRWDWAEEAVQETFCCAFESLHTYNSAYSFRTWLWTILLNQCRRLYKKRRQHPMESLSETILQSQTTSSSDSPPTRAICRERDAQLHQLLETLPEPDADALRLRFFGDLKFHEIADAMQCGISTAKNRVRRGLERLSMRLQTSEADDAVAVRQSDAGS